MTVLQLKREEYIVHKGAPMKALYVVLRGSVRMRTEYNEIILTNGSVLGVAEANNHTYLCDYIVNEDAMIAAYRFEKPEDYLQIFAEQPKYSYAFLHAAIAQCKVVFEKYKRLEEIAKSISDFVTKQYSAYAMDCSQASFEQKEVMVAELQQLNVSETVSLWEMNYYQELMTLPEKNIQFYYNDHEDLCVGELLRISGVLSRLLVNMDDLKEYLMRAKDSLICEEEDLLELWYDLAMKLAYRGDSTMMVQVKVFELQEFLGKIGLFTSEEVSARMKYYTSMDFQLYVLTHKAEEMKAEEQGEVAEQMSREDVLKTDFVTHIMEYGGYEKEDIDKCRLAIRNYAAVAEAQDNTTPECQKARKELTAFFYAIYEKAFLRAVKAKTISPVMELFFQFGVMDLSLIGRENAESLLDACDAIYNQQEEQKARVSDGEVFTRVYTIYQWLGMVYRGEREPSKNEFDVDYLGDLLEQRKNGYITRSQENELKHDQVRKVQFEIRNMFTTNNRVTYGRITSFCPVLHKKDFIRSADQMLLTLDKVNEVMDEIRGLDYSCFYREVHFMAPDHGIERTEIMKEVLPEIILMPNIGNRAMMWQETSGVKRDTPARFIFPVMTFGDVSQMMLETIGRYRWEICRKILGVRWNDIREKSLTSEFYDYVQFYRKNRELTPQAKEKVKADLLHAKNNYREVFVGDYVGWMKYESQGSFRLNKVSRRIISDYIPFPQEVKKSLADNPMYKELFTKNDIIRGRKREKEKVLFERYRAAGGVMTPELEAHMAFYNK